MTEQKSQYAKSRRILYYSRIFGPAESAFQLILKLLLSNAGRDEMAEMAYAVILTNGWRYRSSIATRAGRANSTGSFSKIDEGICYEQCTISRVNPVNGARSHRIDERRSSESLSMRFVNVGRHFGLKVLERAMFNIFGVSRLYISIATRSGQEEGFICLGMKE
jgi:hypothetical protein